MRKLLKNQKGETLVESLVSLLIATLSVMLLTSALTASARINHTNKLSDEKYIEELKNAEEYQREPTELTEEITVVIEFKNGIIVEKNVEVFGLTDGRLIYYKQKEEVEP